MLKIVICLFVAIVLAFSLIDSSSARVTKISVSGIAQDLTVRRDGRSIPYISAANERDLYFAQGYATASDRLFQMDLMRRLARGETAEIFGKQSLEEDKRWRRFGFAKISEDSLQYLSDDLKTALQAYADGVNAHIATLDEKTLPVEFRILQYKPREWKPADSLAIGKILADALSTTWRQDLLRASLQSLPKEKFDELTNQVTAYDVVLFGKDTKAKSTVARAPSIEVSDELSAIADLQETIRRESLSRVGLYAEDLAASNNWVISGKRTADGKAILANDPHLQPTAPGIWYLTHLSTPTSRVSGVTFPGVPGIVLGHNENIAWGATNVGPDAQDLYVETFNANGQYKTASGWETPQTRKEEIRVRVNPLKTDVETVTLDVVETRNGPIILEEGGKKYALKWTARDPRNSDFAAFYLLNRAKNWNEFNAALRTYRGATQNFVYADTAGNIGWRVAGAIPIRKTGDGALPYDGSTNDGEWTGLIPFEELPNLYNPPSGFIMTANQRMVGTDYKHFGKMSRDAAPPWRARRLFDLLGADKKATMDSVAAAQMDSFNIPLSNLAKEIVRLGAASPETIAQLKAWDGRMTPDSKAALLINEIRACLADTIAADNKGVPTAAIRERVLENAVKTQKTLWLPKAYADYPSFIKFCDSRLTANLSSKYGTDPAGWTWSAVSKSRFFHPLAAAPFIGGQFQAPALGLEGSGQTPNVASFVSMRHIASPGNWDATRHVIPLGQSGDPQSPHFKDQFEAWRTGTPTAFPFSKEAVEKAAVSSITLTPYGRRTKVRVPCC